MSFNHRKKNMQYLNQLTGRSFSLSLVVCEKRGKGVIAYLVPTHLVGNPVIGVMDRTRMTPSDGKPWYPVFEGDDLISALAGLETSISVVLSRTRNGEIISVEKFAAMTWNTAVSTIQHNRPVLSVTAILKMEDISQLIPRDKADPPSCGI
jgi:hypothetical protein